MDRPLHPDFQKHLNHKEAALVEQFTDLRQYVLTLYPNCNELLYHTHALTALFSVSEKMSDAFCMIPIYSKHLNLGFNKGTMLKDPKKLLQGTGKLIRHIPIEKPADYKNGAVKALLAEAYTYAVEDIDKAGKISGKTISKIKS